MKEIASRKIRLTFANMEEIPGYASISKLNDGRYICVICSCRMGGCREIGFLTLSKRVGITKMIEDTVNTIQNYKLTSILH